MTLCVLKDVWARGFSAGACCQGGLAWFACVVGEEDEGGLEDESQTKLDRRNYQTPAVAKSPPCVSSPGATWPTAAVLFT